MSILPISLRCEYLQNPLGIDVAHPRLSWILQSRGKNARNQRQTAYRILVASSDEYLIGDHGDFWDSGKIELAKMNQVVYKGRPLQSRNCCIWKVRVWDQHGQISDWSEPARFTIGLLDESDWQAKWIGAPPESPYKGEGDPLIPPSPLLRKSFQIKGKIKHALAYVTSLGVYEFRLNGLRVGNHILAPEWTDYHKRVQYQTYVVTDLLHPGENVAGAILGDGWYAGRLGPVRWDKDFPRRGGYGPDRRFLLQLEIELADGSRQTIVSDDSWKIYLDGPIRSADNFLGEFYDASKEQPGWDQPGFNGWHWQAVTVDRTKPAKQVAQMSEPIAVVKELQPIAITEPKPGAHIFDMGQNLVGRCKIRLDGRARAKVTLRHGEILNLDGTLHTANLGSASQADIFLPDRKQGRDYEPHFTYHGFRYVEVTGLKSKLSLDMLTGRAIASSAPQTSEFKCSNPMLNKLFENIIWSQRGNMQSVPTDCPQRDERMGWLGDAQVFAQTAIFNMDMAAFFNKWIQDIRDAQTADGRYPDFAPHPYNPEQKFSDAPGWAGAGIIVPWRLYENYGDIRILETHYDSSIRFIENIRANNPRFIWENCTGNKYGDWLNGDTIQVDGYPKEGGAVPFELFATAMWAQSTETMAKTAGALGKKSDAKEYDLLLENIHKRFNQHFVSHNGRIEGDTQAGYALVLYLNLLPDSLRPTAVQHLLKALEKYDWRLSTGFITTIMLMKVLTSFGYNEIAFKLIESRRCPSWGYCIEQGATTLWERWDAYVASRGIQDSEMNSFNHYAFGSVGEWMFRTILGINPAPEKPGWEHIIIRPKPGGSLTWAHGYYDSIRGRIAVAWRLENERIHLDVEIPVNTTAIVYVPTRDGKSVLESGRPVDNIEGIEKADLKTDAPVFHLGSGKYCFSALFLNKAASELKNARRLSSFPK